MNARTEYDVCVVGAGSAGLSVAAGVSQLGLKTVLVEAGKMGGECLNVGCVPSKALLAGAKAVHAMRRPAIPGLAGVDVPIDRSPIDAHRRAVIEMIAPNDSVERFEGLGVEVVKGEGRFVAPDGLVVADRSIRARRFVVATGSRPVIPPIPGLDADKILTNDTIFDLGVVPSHLVIIGGGPIGIEMAQAHLRLGSRVTLLARGSILPRDEAELVAILRDRLRAEGVDILEQATIERVTHSVADGRATVRIAVRGPGGSHFVDGSHILVAAGRRANVDTLDVEKAGIEIAPGGIVVDRRLRTSNRNIFAFGDVIDGPRFTHVASYQAGIVVRNLAFRLPARVSYDALPWVTFADPELAHVGLTLETARGRHGDAVRAISLPLSKVDRAVTEARTEGMIKVVADRQGRILGCSILAPSAGEMIGLWALAISKGLSLRDVAGVILPYPTYGEAARLLAGDWYKPLLFGRRSRQLVSALRLLPALRK